MAVKLPRAVYDGTLQTSLISKARAAATHGSISPKPLVNLVDSTGQTHTSRSAVTLRWYYDNGLQTFQETFYIVDKLPQPDGSEWDAMLRAGVQPSPEQSPPQAHPYQTRSMKPDVAQDRKKREAERQQRYEAEREAEKRRVYDLVKKQAASKK
jgi:hypothetical protein